MSSTKGELFNWYLWAIDPETGISFPNNTAIEEDDRDDIETKIIRMITRIMFVWFIKQKDLVPNRLFDSEYLQTILKDFEPQSTTNGSYYNAILQNLFFATLNRAIVDEDGNKRKFATATKRDIKTLYRYAELFTISEQQIIDVFSEVPFRYSVYTFRFSLCFSPIPHTILINTRLIIAANSGISCVFPAFLI